MQSPSEGRKEKSQPETVARRKRDLKKAGFEIAREIEVREKKKEERRNRKKMRRLKEDGKIASLHHYFPVSLDLGERPDSDGKRCTNLKKGNT